ncbi:MAG: efflux RND transporter periplasmic adaptor subunit [Cyanomargarita calcarea GSE-NOS-MK-12-04C]|jgi:HlyD family secretion protein|uniref:Efflux RND transporter periplasmic adaptor subunit n=1 Tax=Cyanomargarita calcarea GSE-NOS-MK-12-04C TaxID=2839659 RepID=A0A951UVF9_9CYAN|nr:efflux RND transporter periplasmic adaptor subunit [Cyanomargarita calcarea GSE-NOS-MK-12-04C]
MKLDTSHPSDTPQFIPNLKKFKIFRLSWLLILLLVGGGLSYVAYNQLVIIPSKEAKRRVLTVPVERQTLAITISANGTVKAERLINVSPKNAGILKRLLVKEGDSVKNGEVIAYMDDSNFQGQLTQAKGQLASAEANLQKLIAGNRPQEIAQSQAQLEEAQVNLQKLIAGNRSQDIAQSLARLEGQKATLNQKEDDLRRNQQLYQAGAISRQIVNQKRSERDAAIALVREAEQAAALQKVGSRQEDIQQARTKVKQQQQTLSLLKAGTRKEEIAQAQAQVISARGSLQTVQAQINDTVIRAPFDGLVTKKYADPGSFVTPTTAASAVSSAVSSSILALASKNQVVANLAESNIAKIAIGQPVTIKADAYPGTVFRGRVSEIAAQATVEQNVTSFEVKVAILSDSKNLLRSGMNVGAEFQVGQLENAQVVPTVAVVRQENETGVFVAGKDNKPVFTPIETGATVNNKTEVKSGLKGSERVLISFPPGSRPRSKPRGGVFPGVGGGGGGPSRGGSP